MALFVQPPSEIDSNVVSELIILTLVDPFALVILPSLSRYSCFAVFIGLCIEKNMIMLMIFHGSIGPVMTQQSGS